MKSNHKTTILLVLFFGGLLTVWGLDRAGVRTQWEDVRRADRVLPDLIDTPTEEIRRVAIDRGDEHMVFSAGPRPGHWQIVEPMDVAAEPSRIEALVRNLKDLRKSPDAGTMTVPSESFGLTPPAATVRLFASPRGSTGADRPIASLQVGKVVHDRRYVQREGVPGIDVVERDCSVGSTSPSPPGASRSSWACRHSRSHR